MIKICKFADRYEELTKALNENNIEYTADECLHRCDLCHSTAYVQKGDEFIFDDDIEALIARLKA